MKVDVVIVGSGISGLTAASILAKKGKSVVIVEKNTNPGGSLRQFKRKSIGYDVGFHYTGGLGEGEILSQLLGYNGALDALDVISLGSEGYDHFEFDDDKLGTKGPIRGYFSYALLQSELESYFPSEKNAIADYLQRMSSICAEVPFYNTKLPLTPFLRGYKSRPSSLDKYLTSITSDSRLRAILTAPGFLYGVPAKLASLEVHALVAHGYYSGAYTVAGGGQAIVDALLQAFAKAGGKILCGQSVESITIEGGAVVGVYTASGEKIQCADVIYTGHPATFLDTLPEGVFRPAYKTRLRELQNSLSMFAVFAKSKKRLDTLKGPLNYYVLPGNSEVLPAGSNTPAHKRPLMMTSSRAGSTGMLQQGGNGIILLRLGYWQDVERFAQSGPGNRPPEYQQYKRSIARGMIEVAENRWGPLCGEIEPVAIGTPLTFRDELAAPDGCAYGAMHRLDQFNPDVRTRCAGLYLAGQSTLMTGVVGASISGFVAAGEILGLETLWEELRK